MILMAASRISFAWAVILVLMAPGVCVHAAMNQQALLRLCKTQVAAKFPDWRLASVSREVAEWARQQREDPAMMIGDFDGDGQKDVALLIQTGPAIELSDPGRLESRRIAVCLNQRNVTLRIIDHLYCGDGISLARKGGSYHDFESETQGTYLHDGISAYCFEKAGATYQFQDGGFHRIIDSD
jgi:hypothetical protein